MIKKSKIEKLPSRVVAQNGSRKKNLLSPESLKNSFASDDTKPVAGLQQLSGGRTAGKPGEKSKFSFDGAGSQQSQLPDWLNSLITNMEVAADFLLGDEISRMAVIHRDFGNFRFLMRAAAAFELCKNSRQTGGAGNIDTDGTGCLKTYQHVGEMFGVKGSTVGDDVSIYRHFIIDKLPPDSTKENLAAARNELIRGVFKMSRAHHLAALKMPDAANSMAYAAKRMAETNGNFSAKQLGREIQQQKIAGQNRLSGEPAESSVQSSELPVSAPVVAARAFKVELQLNYRSFEFLQHLTAQTQATESAVVEALLLEKEAADNLISDQTEDSINRPLAKFIV